MAASFKRKELCYVISCTDFDEFGVNCCCFGCTESIADSVDYMRRQGYPLDVKVKQNDVKIPIFLDKFQVICLLLLEVCFAMCWIVVIL